MKPSHPFTVYIHLSAQSVCIPDGNPRKTPQPWRFSVVPLITAADFLQMLRRGGVLIDEAVEGAHDQQQAVGVCRAATPRFFGNRQQAATLRQHALACDVGAHFRDVHPLQPFAEAQSIDAKRFGAGERCGVRGFVAPPARFQQCQFEGSKQFVHLVQFVHVRFPMMASAKAWVLTSVAPSIRRAKS